LLGFPCCRLLGGIFLLCSQQEEAMVNVWSTLGWVISLNFSFSSFCYCCIMV
jgi:hypothetical protein